MKSAFSVFRLFRGCPLLLAATLPLAGCYDADALLKERTEAAKVIRMEEIDLGAFSVSLPHKLGQAADNIVEFHAFGQVDSGDKAKVAYALQTRAPELRSRMLIAVRSLTDADFDEAKLAKLRASIAEVINSALKEKLVKKVGFYDYAFTTTI